jgi:uncharacterized heparinase superfamily protein
MLKKFLLYLWTLQDLKPSQIYGRILFFWFLPKLDLNVKRLRVRSWPKPCEEFLPTPPSLKNDFCFTFLNKTFYLIKNTDWNNLTKEKLWLYNLHYFDFLNAVNRYDFLHDHELLIEKWIDDNPPPIGIGWEPYTSSLRIVNWIKYARSGGLVPTQKMLSSLFVQARWLEKRIEWHILGNHLLSNAKALVYAGLFFDCEESQNWLLKGLRIFKCEIEEQILGDGGHFERSPMYQSIVIVDILDILNVLKASNVELEFDFIPLLRQKVISMITWSDYMGHPDGDISFFNDAAQGISPTIEVVKNYALSLDIKIAVSSKPNKSCSLVHLKESGYIRLESTSAVALIDVAEIGPRYLPGHAHADTLSFELSIFGERFIVNGGTSTYAPNCKRRSLERSTYFHNTVEIDGENSSEVWGAFRVARRAKPFDLKIEASNLEAKVECSHDGYSRLSKDLVHRRGWIFQDRKLSVVDQVSGSFNNATAGFIFHPHVEVTRLDETTLILKCPKNDLIAIFRVHNSGSAIINFNYAPQFGLIIPTKSIRVPIKDGNSIVSITW